MEWIWKITTIRDSGISGKSERFTGKIRLFLGWTCYTCENTSLFSRKSRVLHTFKVCAPTGVYKRKGGPRSSHYFAFQKYCRQLMCMEMEILLVFIPGILSKRCFTSATLVFWTRKNFRQPKGLTTIIFNKSIFLLVFHLIPKGVLWGVYEWNFKKLFPS